MCLWVRVFFKVEITSLGLHLPTYLADGSWVLVTGSGCAPVSEIRNTGSYEQREGILGGFPDGGVGQLTEDLGSERETIAGSVLAEPIHESCPPWAFDILSNAWILNTLHFTFGK